MMAWFEPEPSSWCAQRAFTASAPRPHEHNSLPDPADLHIDLFISHPPYIGEVETHVQPQLAAFSALPGAGGEQGLGSDRAGSCSGNSKSLGKHLGSISEVWAAHPEPARSSVPGQPCPALFDLC